MVRPQYPYHGYLALERIQEAIFELAFFAHDVAQDPGAAYGVG